MLSCCIVSEKHLDSLYLGAVTTEINCAIRRMIKQGCIHFYFTFTSKAELLFARLVAMHRQDYPSLKLHAVFPYRRRYAKALQKAQHVKLLSICDEIHILSEHCHSGAFTEQQRFLISNSETVIAVYSSKGIEEKHHILELAKVYQREVIFCVPLLLPLWLNRHTAKYTIR